MSRGFYNTGAPFLYTGGEATVGPGMDCLQLRHQQPTGPFHYLISEQAKSLVALQELQHEVGALLEFRDLVIETFPNLRTKLATSTPATMTTSAAAALPASSIPVRDWAPGVRVRKKLGGKEAKKADAAVQDSGFSTETSSKETHSASSTTPNALPQEDELWSLLDLIHRRGTRLRDELEALQGSLRDDETDFQRTLFTRGSCDDLRQLRQERDLLLERLADMEAEVLASRVHTDRLQEDLEDLLAAKQELEEQLGAVVTQRGEVNSRIHDLHLQFVTKSGGGGGREVRAEASQRGEGARSELDAVLGERLSKVRRPDSAKFAAILMERDPRVLQKHLLNSTVQNQVLHEQLDTAVKLELGLSDKLNKAREENDELRFQLEDKNVELVGTKAQLRMLEKLHRPADSSGPSSMKATSPQPEQHSSSTESAHHLEPHRRRRPSKIPLKSYTAPRPPAAPRSRSGGSPGRPHSAQSWRAASLAPRGQPSPRAGSLISAKDSLSCKLRGSESLARLGAAAPARKEDKESADPPKTNKSQYPWIFSSYNSDGGSLLFPDSLDLSATSIQPTTIETSSSHRFQTANTFLWNVIGAEADQTGFYDSIDSNLTSSLYQQDNLADSLEKVAK